MIAHLGHEEAEDAFRRDTLDVLTFLIVDEAFSTAENKFKAILKKVEKAAMLSNRKFDPQARKTLCDDGAQLNGKRRTEWDHG